MSAVAIASLALGIGANAAIFSLFEQTLLRPLPVPAAGRLINLGNPGPKPGSQSCGQAGDCDIVFSYPMFRDLERSQKVLTGIAAHVLFGANLALRDHTPVSSQGVLVSGSYFQVLDLKPAAGRLFTPADDQTLGGDFTAVLSYGYWHTQLGSDPGVVGKVIIVNGQPLTIIGVAPQGFTGTTLGADPRVFVPISMRGLMLPGWQGFEKRRWYWAYLFGRLKPGVELAQARVSLNTLYHGIITSVEVPLQKGMSEKTMAEFKAKPLVVSEGSKGQSDVHQSARTPLTLLFALTGLVLLIACANIANLLLARGASRSMEMAVRLSLGASRGQVLRQLMGESLLLALLGGAASLLVARWTLHGIAALLPSDAVQALHLGLETPMVIFAAGVAVATGFLFGMFPALHSTRSDLVTTIRSGAGQLAGARAATRFRSALVTAQIALSMALLISAGLFLKSLWKVSRVDLGIEIDHVLTFGVSPELNGYKPERSRVFFARLEEELRAIPGVQGVTVGMVGLIQGNNWGNSVNVEGFPRGPDVDNNSRWNEVGAGYFKTLGIPLLSGREFTDADALGGPKVAIVNEAFARKFHLGRNAVGKRIGSEYNGNEQLDVEIVGLVKDAKYSDVKQVIPPVFFQPYRQDSTVGSLSVYLRSSLPPEQLVPSLRATVSRLDPNLPIEGLRTLPEQVKENVFLDRMISTLSAAFAGLATLLAAVGLYGVLAYTVAQRTREIGVRMALGADAGKVRAMVLRQVGRMTLIGGVVGIAGAIGLGKAAKSLLFELSATDPLIIGLAAVLSVLVAFVAGYVPALRASRVHPMQALRYE